MLIFYAASALSISLALLLIGHEMLFAFDQALIPLVLLLICAQDLLGWALRATQTVVHKLVVTPLALALICTLKLCRHLATVLNMFSDDVGWRREGSEAVAGTQEELSFARGQHEDDSGEERLAGTQEELSFARGQHEDGSSSGDDDRREENESFAASGRLGAGEHQLEEDGSGEDEDAADEADSRPPAPAARQTLLVQQQESSTSLLDPLRHRLRAASPPPAGRRSSTTFVPIISDSKGLGRAFATVSSETGHLAAAVTFIVTSEDSPVFVKSVSLVVTLLPPRGAPFLLWQHSLRVEKLVYAGRGVASEVRAVFALPESALMKVAQCPQGTLELAGGWAVSL
jgi:hypothetical protein